MLKYVLARCVRHGGSSANLEADYVGNLPDWEVVVKRGTWDSRLTLAGVSSVPQQTIPGGTLRGDAHSLVPQLPTDASAFGDLWRHAWTSMNLRRRMRRTRSGPLTGRHGARSAVSCSLAV